jgi:hypothetical protein
MNRTSRDFLQRPSPVKKPDNRNAMNICPFTPMPTKSSVLTTVGQ